MFQNKKKINFTRTNIVDRPLHWKKTQNKTICQPCYISLMYRSGWAHRSEDEWELGAGSSWQKRRGGKADCMWGLWNRGETEEMEKLRATGKVKGRLGIDCRVRINSITGLWWSLNGLSSALMVYNTSRNTWLNYRSSIDCSISVIWLLYSPASSSYKGKLWWPGMLSWHFLSGANQCKSWTAFVDISQGEQHGRYHCHSLIAIKRQKWRDKHTWIYNVQSF